MYLAIIVLPLLGSIVSGFLGRKVGVVGSHIITCACVIWTTVLSFVAFLETGFNNIPVSLHLFKWIDSESLNVYWGFNFDSLTVSMLIPVLLVSSLVHIYSIGYMSNDPHNQRFFSYLSLFTFMMIILVTANNYLLMFLGWEGVGVCSYLLVSFWFTRIAANQSSLSAFLTNRVGDCLLTIGIFALLWSFGNIDYATVFSLAPYMNQDLITIIGICLLIGAMAKSSQIGLHIWLPMAMEGPTPVSALIHAATMVTAGVYLLMRSSPLIEYSSTVLLICLWLGAITTVFSSLIGLFQQDIKKVIAYSTMSQLGMMVIAVGLSSYNIALFHLVNHAFYKGLLFLGAGAVIHAVADNQDFRKYGALKQFLPLTYSVMFIASLSLVAFPFMTGFYSKDFILESAYGQFYLSSTIVYFIATIGAMFTTLYSVKVLYLTFLTNPNGPLNSYVKAHEGDIFMSLPLVILAIFSIFFGYITKDIFIGLGSSFFADNSLFIHPNHELMLDTEFAVPSFYKLLPLFFTISLTITSLILSEFIPKTLILFKFTRFGYNLFGFFNQRFLIELFYNKFITGFVLKLGGQTTKVLDKGSIELIGPFGLEKALLNLSKNLSTLSTGVVTSYALYILLGLITFILIPLLFIADNNLIILIFIIIFAYFKNNHLAIKDKGTVSVKTLNSSLLSLPLNITIKKAFVDFFNCLTPKFMFRKLFYSFCFMLAIFAVSMLLKQMGFQDKHIGYLVFTCIACLYMSRIIYAMIYVSFYDGIYLFVQLVLNLILLFLLWKVLGIVVPKWFYSYLLLPLNGCFLNGYSLEMNPGGSNWPDNTNWPNTSSSSNSGGPGPDPNNPGVYIFKGRDGILESQDWKDPKNEKYLSQICADPLKEYRDNIQEKISSSYKKFAEVTKDKPVSKQITDDYSEYEYTTTDSRFETKLHLAVTKLQLDIENGIRDFLHLSRIPLEPEKINPFLYRQFLTFFKNLPDEGFTKEKIDSLIRERAETGNFHTPYIFNPFDRPAGWNSENGGFNNQETEDRFMREQDNKDRMLKEAFYAKFLMRGSMPDSELVTEIRESMLKAYLDKKTETEARMKLKEDSTTKVLADGVKRKSSVSELTRSMEKTRLQEASSQSKKRSRN